MLITRFGHSAVLVETGDARILIDPGIFSSQEAFRLKDLDAIVVTHQHPDHIDHSRIELLTATNPRAILITDVQTQALVSGWQTNADGTTFTVKGVTITGVGQLHAPILPTIPRISNVGVLITAEGKPLFFHPGDSYEYCPEGVHVLALPLTAPWAKISETIDFVQGVGAPMVFPIHDSGLTEDAYDMYWGQVAVHGKVEDLHRLPQDGHLEVVS